MSELPEDAPSGRPSGSDALVLSGQQFALIQAIERLELPSERPLHMYREALRAIQRVDSPESLHVSGYEIREMMNALPPLIGVSSLPRRELAAETRHLQNSWISNAIRSGCHDNGNWKGEVDNRLRSFLKKAGSFLEWFAKNDLTRRQEGVEMFKRFPEGDVPTPQALRDLGPERWSELLKYFNSTTHHDVAVSQQEFLERLGELEALLLAHLSPATADDQDAIDALISEVEGQ